MPHHGEQCCQLIQPPCSRNPYVDSIAMGVPDVGNGIPASEFLFRSPIAKLGEMGYNGSKIKIVCPFGLEVL